MPGRESSYPRNAIIKNALLSQGIDIIECSSNGRNYFIRYSSILKKFLFNRDREYDLIFIGFFGQPLVPVIKKLTDKTIIFDAFLSAYDTICFDRKIFNPKSPTGKFFYWIDKNSCEVADKVLLDTNAHIEYFVNTFFMERSKFKRVFVGADENIFYPRKRKYSKKFKIFYYGTYKPSHGTEYIVKAAKKLEKYKDIEFEIVGKGMEYRRITKLARQIDVKNIRFIKWLPYEDIPLHIAEANICLGGHFGCTEKAKRVIAGKTFQFIAMKKPVIVGDNLANKELFKNEENALMVEHGNENSLAEAILKLKENKDLADKIAENGYKTFQEKCSMKKMIEELRELLEDLQRRLK